MVSKSKNYFSKYWKDVIWQASGNSLAQLVGIIAIPILTRMYSPSDFAIQSIFLQVVTFITAITTWRYEYLIQLPINDRGAQSISLLVFILGLVSIICFAPLFWINNEIIAEKLGIESLAPWLPLAVITATFVSWAVASQHYTQRKKDFKTSGFSELIGKLVYVVTGISGYLINIGVGGLILTTGIAAVGKLIYNLAKGSKSLYKIFDISLYKVKLSGEKYLKLASSTVISHLLSVLAVAIPQISIAHLYNANVLGNFALVLTTVYLPSGLLGAAIGQVYYQRAAEIRANGKPFFELWRETVIKLVIIGVPLYGCVALVSKIIYPFVFGENWGLAGEMAQWMSLAALGSFISSPMDRTCLVVGAWLYSILWSLLRVVTAIAVILMCWIFDLKASDFIVALSIQMFIMYCIDFYMSYRFSNLK